MRCALPRRRRPRPSFRRICHLSGAWCRHLQSPLRLRLAHLHRRYRLRRHQSSSLRPRRQGHHHRQHRRLRASSKSSMNALRRAGQLPPGRMASQALAFFSRNSMSFPMRGSRGTTPETQPFKPFASKWRTSALPSSCNSHARSVEALPTSSLRTSLCQLAS